MTLYESIPQQVEAVQWTGRNLSRLHKTFAAHVIGIQGADPVLAVRAGKDGAQGWVPVPVGHWIVHKPGDFSDLWPVHPDIFASKYRPVHTTTKGDT